MGMVLNSVESVLEDLRQGKVIVLIDDENRENEGDLVVAGDHATGQRFEQAAEHGFARFCSAPGHAPLDQGDGQFCKVLHPRTLVIGHWPGIGVEYAQRAQPMTAFDLENNGAVKTHMRRVGHHRVLCEPRVTAGVRDLNQPVFAKQLSTHRNLTRRFNCLDAVAALEPLAFGIDERDQRMRHIAQPRGQA